MNAVVRYGILGASNIARTQHVPAANAAVHSRIVAVGSRDPGTAQRFAAETGISRAHGSYQALLDDPEIDAVIITLPNSLHCEWAIRAAAAGKHILCEKPLAVTVAEAQRMIAAAQSGGVLLMEGFTHRFTPAVRRMRELLQAGRIGAPLTARAVLTYSVPDWQNDTRVRRDLAGGALLDAGCYCVSALRFVLGAEPTHAFGWERIRQPNGVDGSFAGELVFPGGYVGSLFTSQEAPLALTLEIVGLDGTLRTPDFFRSTELNVWAGGVVNEERFEPMNRFRVQIDHFSECILGGRQPEFSPEDARRNTAALAALKESASGHTLVALA